MPYQVSWYKANRVLWVELYGALSDAESREISDVNTRYINEGIAPVHIIVDINRLEKFPTNLRQNSGFMQYLSTPSLGWVVVVGLSNNVLAKFAVSILSQVIRFRLTQRESMEEAMIFLESQDDTLKENTKKSRP